MPLLKRSWSAGQSQPHQICFDSNSFRVRCALSKRASFNLFPPKYYFECVYSKIISNSVFCTNTEVTVNPDFFTLLLLKEKSRVQKRQKKKNQSVVIFVHNISLQDFCLNDAYNMTNSVHG